MSKCFALHFYFIYFSFSFSLCVFLATQSEFPNHRPIDTERESVKMLSRASHMNNMLLQYVDTGRIFPNRCSLLIYQSFTLYLLAYLPPILWIKLKKYTCTTTHAHRKERWHGIKWIKKREYCMHLKRLKLSVCLSRATSSTCILFSNWMRPTKFFFFCVAPFLFFFHDFSLCWVSPKFKLLS